MTPEQADQIIGLLAASNGAQAALLECGQWVFRAVVLTLAVVFFHALKAKR